MSSTPDVRGIYFDSSKLENPKYDYVCWLDVMGTKNQMLRSLPVAANFIFKLQSSVLEARDEMQHESEVRLYPTIDGIYITSSSRFKLQDVVNQAMCRCALSFLKEKDPKHQFLVRGAIAYGPVYHGSDLDPQATFVMANHSQVRDSILIGLPMIQAFQAESEAPPFGVSIHESARAFCPSGEMPFAFIWLDWFSFAKPRVEKNDMLASLGRYFDYQRNHSTITGYKEERIAYHFKLAKEYLSV